MDVTLLTKIADLFWTTINMLINNSYIQSLLAMMIVMFTLATVAYLVWSIMSGRDYRG